VESPQAPGIRLDVLIDCCTSLCYPPSMACITHHGCGTQYVVPCYSRGTVNAGTRRHRGYRGLLRAGFALQRTTSETALHDDATRHDATSDPGGEDAPTLLYLERLVTTLERALEAAKKLGRPRSWSERPSGSRSYVPSRRSISASWSRDACCRASRRALA
jgi:hypothetical protein